MHSRKQVLNEVANNKGGYHSSEVEFDGSNLSATLFVNQFNEAQLYFSLITSVLG